MGLDVFLDTMVEMLETSAENHHGLEVADVSLTGQDIKVMLVDGTTYILRIVEA